MRPDQGVRAGWFRSRLRGKGRLLTRDCGLVCGSFGVVWVQGGQGRAQQKDGGAEEGCGLDHAVEVQAEVEEEVF